MPGIFYFNVIKNTIPFWATVNWFCIFSFQLVYTTFLYIKIIFCTPVSFHTANVSPQDIFLRIFQYLEYLLEILFKELKQKVGMVHPMDYTVSPHYVTSLQSI